MTASEAGEDERTAAKQIGGQRYGTEDAHGVGTARRRLEDEREDLWDDNQAEKSQGHSSYLTLAEQQLPTEHLQKSILVHSVILYLWDVYRVIY